MKYLNSKETADILGINISTLKRWTDGGVLDCKKTIGGHRKFTMKNVRDYFKENKKASKNLGIGLENSNHKRIYKFINDRNYRELASSLADASIESQEVTISTIITGCYMSNISTVDICDYVIEPASIIVENALQQQYLTHVEAFVSRKLITRSVEVLNTNKPNEAKKKKKKSVLCVNFEDNLPDLGVVMSDLVLRHQNYNVFNTGSHAELGSLESIVKKKNISIILFYLCNLQCCMATVEKNLKKTEEEIVNISRFLKKLGVKSLFGGSGLDLLPNLKNTVTYTFETFSDLAKIV